MCLVIGLMYTVDARTGIGNSSLDGVAVCIANEELIRENRIKVWSDNVVCIITEIPLEKEL